MSSVRGRARSLAIRLLIGVVVAGAAVSVPAAARAAGGAELVAGANAQRSSAGVAPVGELAALNTIAQERANQLAATRTLAHDFDYIKLRLGQLRVCWSGYGEIIAWNQNGLAVRFIDQWMRSTPHREIMLSATYTRAGGGVTKGLTTGGEEAWYAVMIFLKPCATAPAPRTSSTANVTRLSGPDRYAASAALSRATFATSVSVAYVATGENFPDALAGSAVAGRQRAPLLLVMRDSIPGPIATELARLRPGRIVLLGGPRSVSDRVLRGLRNYTAGGVTRIAGADRYAAAAAISRSAFASGVPVTYIATGEKFPDALAGGPAAASRGGPILLVGRDSLPGGTVNELTRLRPGRIVILGGTASVTERVRRALDRFTTGTVTRIAGADRYAAAASISRAHFAANGPSTVYVATGANFPDGLSAGAAAGRIPGPLLLVPPTSLPSAVKVELTRLSPDRVIIVGGRASVSDAVLRAIDAAVP